MSWAFRRRSSTGWGKERMKKWSIGNLWKKYKYVGLVVLAGIVLMVLPAGTSAPDPQKDSGGFSLEDTERRMLQNIMDSGDVRTCILITHRPNTARICTRRYVLRGTALSEAAEEEPLSSRQCTCNRPQRTCKARYA